MPAVLTLFPVAETVIAALCSVLLMGLGVIIKYAVTGILNGINIFKFDVSTISKWIEDWMIKAGQHWWEQSLAPLTAVIYTPVMFFDSYFTSVGDTFEHIGQQVLDMPHTVASYIGLTSLKSALSTMESDVSKIRSAAQELTSVQDNLDSAIKATAGAMVSSAVASVEADIHSGVAAAETYAKQQAASAAAIGAAAQQAVNKLAVQVGQMAQSLEHLTAQIGGLTPSAVTKDVQAALDAAESFTKSADTALGNTIANSMSQAEQDAANLVNHLSGTVQTSLSNLGQTIGATRNQLTNEIAAAESAAETYADKLANQIRQEVGAVAESATEAGAAAATVATDLATYLEQCGNILCGNVKPQVPWIQDLEGIFEDGMIFALIAEMIADPEGAAQEILSIVQPVANLSTAVVQEMMPRWNVSG